MIRKLFWPGVMSAGMFVVLLGLGTWQVHRLAWKEAILAQIAQAEAGPPVPLPVPRAVPSPAAAGQVGSAQVGSAPAAGGTAPAQPDPFTKVAVTGRLMHDKAALYGADVRDTRTGPELGGALIEPLQRDGAVPILVDRGWVPLKPSRPVAMPDGQVTVVGFVYPGAKLGLFSARDDVAGRHFYTLDPAAIGAALGLGHVAPYILVALGDPAAPGAPSVLPIPADHLPRPPNNHLQYAITWYGLAAALLVIFFVWARKAVRA